jgi:thiol-disulfide isomerase/thioredoxin
VRKGVIIVLVIGIAAALGILARQQLSADGGATDTAAATVVSTADPATAAPAATPQPPVPKIPDTLPQFSLADRDGHPRRLGEWRGQPLMVNFWATWCGPCRREIPLLNKLRVSHRAMKLEIVGIAVDFRDDVLKYAKQNPISYPVLIGEEDGLAAVQAMGVAEPAFPFTVFADSHQRILALKLGELHQDEADFILERLAKVDAGSLPVAKARQQITEGLKEIATRRAAAGAGGVAAG